jgi:hypothetical protein
MKKIIATVLSLALVAVFALPAAAQGRNWNNANQGYTASQNGRRDPNADYNYRNRNDSNYPDRSNDYNRQRSNQYDYSSQYDNNGYDQRGVWQQHRDKLTTAMGAAGGAILGGAIGGGRGSLIGALIGGAGSALYTYKLRDRNH